MEEEKGKGSKKGKGKAEEEREGRIGRKKGRKVQRLDG